ncbi:unnamed protein product [Meloidogyne enterolobii]|uniref:Uncharacterized protein n=1 Tax=Meloidogyne enterolobii TaxID=390850 RepID=A0ACB1AQS7_MELEN
MLLSKLYKNENFLEPKSETISGVCHLSLISPFAISSFAISLPLPSSSLPSPSFAIISLAIIISPCHHLPFAIIISPSPSSLPSPASSLPSPWLPHKRVKPQKSQPTKESKG